MNGTNITTHEGELHGERTERTLKAFAGGGSMAEAIGGVATIVLAIIGLAGANLRVDIMAIATIVVGASLILEGGAIASSFRRALFSLEGAGGGSADVSGAAMFEFLAGFTGIVLGILSLLHVGAVNYLVSVAIIVFGATLLLSSNAVSQLESFWSSASYQSESSRSLAQTSSEAGAGGLMLVGLASIVLGILAVVGINTAILNLVALLVLGTAILLSGTRFGTRTLMQSSKRATTTAATA